MRTSLKALAAFGLLAPLSFGQPNVIPGTDVELGILGVINDLSHIGTFPNGSTAFAMSTTSCNAGTVNVPWLAAMQADHPFIAFLVARETGDRMVQISDRSFVKHGFFALSNSQCYPCQNPSNGTFLGVGCSDTYSISTNADNSWLGPADEIDPWTGRWNPVCSFFDMGQPPVNAPFDCDGNKSPINPPTSLGNRVKIFDEDLDVPNSTFYYQGYYVIRGEPEEDRENNITSRFFTPTWNGSSWITSVPGPATNPQVEGSVLKRWSGATVTSAKNVGESDGRVYVAVKTIDLGGGITRYEYAVHNRDNAAGVDEFRIPVCPTATVSNVGFHDIDGNPANDWTFTRTGTEAVFSTDPAGGNTVRWNTFFNFWFDCDAAPLGNQTAILGQANTLAGEPTMGVETTAPMGPALGSDLGFSTTGSNGFDPSLQACGVLDTGTNGGLMLRFGQPNTVTFLFAGFTNAPTNVLDGTLVPIPPAISAVVPTDANGDVSVQVPGGGGPFTIYVQFLLTDGGTGSGYAFSNAVSLPFGP